MLLNATTHSKMNLSTSQTDVDHHQQHQLKRPNKMSVMFNR